MAIADLDTLVNLVSGGGDDYATPYTSVQNIHFYKSAKIGGSDLSLVIGFQNTWQWNGAPSGGAMVGSSTAIATDATTPGGLGQTNATGGRKLWLAGVTLMEINNSGPSVMLYDRLIHVDGFDATSTSAQTITSGTLTRYNSSTDCLNNQIWLEIHTTIGATQTTASVSYNDANGTARTSDSVTFGGDENKTLGQTIIVPLNPNYPGVTGINSVTLAGTTGTVGNFGVVVARPLSRLSRGELPPLSLAPTTQWANNVVQLPNLTEVKTDACLAFQISLGTGWSFPARSYDFAGCVTLVEA